MKRRSFVRSVVCLATALLLVGSLLLPASAYAATSAVLTFTDTGITETLAGSGYAIDGTTLTITAPGTYQITGACSEGAVVVGKSLSDVTLILDDLDLRSSVTAPLVVKKGAAVLLRLDGASTLTDDEDPALEDTDPDFEGAAVKVKSGASLTIFGTGTLTANGSAKNAIKGGAEAALAIHGGTIVATAANNGIASDGSVTITGGSFNVTSQGDGIKAVPDEGDTASAGTVTISGGSFVIRAQGDGIQAGTNLTISGGSFDIKTLDGYQSSSFNKDTMSCKGLKASGNETDTENATNCITITGGSFLLDTADDAVHSDGDIEITGGTFTIYAGDDGVHADTTLTLGTQNGYERDPEITVLSSYEGLEAGTVNLYSGKCYVTASDDGINAAGGSANGSDPGGGGDHFNPGRPGGGWGGGGGGGDTGSYSLNVYGGTVYVDCKGDGLDSNGALNLLGGTVTVFSQAAGGDNSPLDSDGTLLINGATVFAAGTNPMRETPSASSQSCYTATSRYQAGAVLNVSAGGSLVYSDKLPRSINYLLYSAPGLSTSSCSVSTASTVTACKSNAWQHNWDEGVVQTAATETQAGVMRYTCQSCGAVERKTIPALTPAVTFTQDEDTAPVTVFTARFVTDGHAQVDVYYTQSYETPDETNVTEAIARSSLTGEADGSGEGQINFALRLDEGYTLEDLTITGSYKNLKDLSEAEGIDQLYRITKVAGDLEITVTTKAAQTEPDDPTEPTEPTEPTPAGLPFTDVKEESWYYDAVRYVYDGGLMVGVTDTTFEPETSTTRAMVATILYRLAGSPETAYTAAFTDVREGSWYTEAVTWAAQKGVYLGYPDGTFRPDEPITREQLAAVLCRYVAGKSEQEAELAAFADGGAVSEWALPSVAWAVEQSILHGDENGLLRPQAQATRAELAQVLKNFLACS